MKKYDWAIAGLWAIALAIAVGSVVYGLFFAIGELVKLAAGILAAASALAGAVVDHSLKSLRETELQAQVARDQIALDRKKATAGNYAELLRLLAPFIQQSAQRDQFETIHLLSWVWGSPSVVNATQDFMATRGTRALRNLLLAMRRDVGLEDDGLPATVGALLQPPTPPGALIINDAPA